MATDNPPYIKDTRNCRVCNHPLDKETDEAGGEICFDCATEAEEEFE